MIDRRLIRDFPAISAMLRADHSGAFRVGSTEQHVLEADERAAEQALLALMRAEAVQSGRPIRVTVEDPHGTAVLLIGIAGEVEEESYTALQAEDAPAAEEPAEAAPPMAAHPAQVTPSIPVVEPTIPWAPKPAAVAPSSPHASEPPAEQTVMRVRPRRVAVVELNTGQTFTIGNPVVVGRRPAPVSPMDEVFRVHDVSHTLSKMHARFFWEKGELFGMDLGSANGIVVIDAHGAEHRQPTRHPFRINDGARFELGDVVATFSVQSELGDDRTQTPVRLPRAST